MAEALGRAHDPWEALRLLSSEGWSVSVSSGAAAPIRVDAFCLGRTPIREEGETVEEVAARVVGAARCQRDSEATA